MKKILLILLSVFSFSIIHAEITWTLSDDGTLTISGTDMPIDYSYPNYAPWYSQREKIKKVVIENGVTNIGRNSFYDCNSLTSVTIPNSVTAIGRNAFYDCRSLSSITIPNSVINIDRGLFEGCYMLESNLVNNSNCAVDFRNLTFIDTEQEDGLLIKNNE